MQAPYTLMTYQEQGYLSLYKISATGFIWFICGQKTHMVGNILHGAALLQSDPDYYELFVGGTHGLHIAYIERNVVDKQRRPNQDSDIQTHLMFEIEVKRLWNVPEDDLVFVYPLKIDTDGQ